MISAARVAAGVYISSRTYDRARISRKQRHTVDLPVHLSDREPTDTTFFSGSCLYSLHPIHYARSLCSVLLEHLAQLLHHAPKVIHVGLLATAWKAINHGYTILLRARTSHAVRLR